MLPAGESSALPPRASVFVVEDNEALSEVLQELLTRNGYGVTSVPSARDALDHLEAGGRPDIILLDLMMPGMTGWEFRVEQRLRPGAASIPVVAMSANSSPEARAIDANAYLRKPFLAQDLVDTIERVLVQAERARLAAHTAEFERLRSIGLLAAGIVHEINNPLTFVAGNSELVRKLSAQLTDELPEDADRTTALRLQRSLDQLDRGVERIASVVRSVATFSRPNQNSESAVDVQEVMSASIRLVSNELRHRAHLSLDLKAVPVIRGNSSQLGQVFLNLLINAMHAIPEGAATDHTIRVATYQALSPSREEQVVIEVTDTGCGIPADELPHIFEPFFTTKPLGLGMGLGLSISHGIVLGMGGTITVDSKPREGTAFRVVLPARREEPSPVSKQEVQPLSAPPPPTRRHRLLVVDDEPMICEWLEQMLKDTCDVVALTSSQEALRRIVAGENFDLILCDLMMPELTGMELFDEVSSRRTEVADHMVFMTGGAFTDQAKDFLAKVKGRTLQKPFRLSELFALVEARSARVPVAMLA